MPSSVLFVDPSVTSASAIVVDGVAYGLIGPTNVTASTSSIDGECSDCEDCPPVPCSDPGDLCASYTVNFTFHNPGNPPDDGNYVGTITGSWYTWLGSASQIGGTNVLNIDLTVDFEVVDGVETCTWAMGMAGPGGGGSYDQQRPSGDTPEGAWPDGGPLFDGTYCTGVSLTCAG